MSTRTLLVLGFALAASVPAAGEQPWHQYGRTAQMNACVAGEAAPRLDGPCWSVAAALELSSTACPVVFDGRVYAYAPSPGLLAAFAVSDGELLWSAPLEESINDSWSSPAVDPGTRSVLVASGQSLVALNADTGAVRWTTPLGMDVVNSSVTIAAGRAFVTTAPVDEPGRLFAVRVDPASGTPGTVAWSKPLGLSSGNTPAWIPSSPAAAAAVIVADYDGTIRSLDPSDGRQNWFCTVPDADDGWRAPGGTFWGGVCVDEGFCYAATYCFDGPENNSYVYKLDAATGAFAWRTPSERTSSVPVVCGGMVLVSGGIKGFGSVRKLQAFDKVTGARLWEAPGIGGWTHTPAVVNGICYVGAADSSTGFHGYYAQLKAVDLSLTPQSPSFVAGAFAGAGGSPAYAEGGVYSVGSAGLVAFGWPICGDVNRDCSANILDLLLIRNLLNAAPSSGSNWLADVSGDGKINILDLIFTRNRIGNRCAH